MGMFDEIQCKVPLPAKKGLKTAAEWKNYTFQTKDLDNFLGHYEIRKSGLWVNKIEYSGAEITSQETFVGSASRHPFLAPLEIESEKWVKADFTGYITFYDSINNDADDQHDLWVEFGGHFDKGKLQGKIELLKWEESNNAERKANTKKWKEEAKTRKEYEEEWRYKYFFKYSNRLGRWIFGILRKAHGWIGKLVSWKVESWFRF